MHWKSCCDFTYQVPFVLLHARNKPENNTSKQWKSQINNKENLTHDSISNLSDSFLHSLISFTNFTSTVVGKVTSDGQRDAFLLRQIPGTVKMRHIKIQIN